MRIKRASSKAMKLGDFVAASYELGQAMAPNADVAADLAARHVGRVLVRGRNGRLVAELASLAREFAD